MLSTSSFDTDQKFQVCRRMLSLRTDCVHPRTNRPYILDSSGGKDNSPEGHQVVEPLLSSMPFEIDHVYLQGGFSHGFVSHFANDEDRKYYLTEDPAHLGFVKSLDGVIQNIRVVDYEPGSF